MILHRKDIKRIQEVLDRCPNVDVFEITENHDSGIGSIITMTFAQEVNGLRGNFDVEISGVEDW